MVFERLRRIWLQGRAVAVLPFVMACAADRDATNVEGRPEAPEAQDLAACDETSDRDCPPRGGQSGTEGGSTEACDQLETRPRAPDDVLQPLATSLNQLATDIGSPVVQGRWLAMAAQNELSFELGPIVSAREHSARSSSGGLCDWQLEVQSVTVRTSDGGIDRQAPGRIRRPDPNRPNVVMMDVELAALPDAYLASAAWSPDLSWIERVLEVHELRPRDDESASLVVYFRFEGPSLYMVAAAFARGEVVGVWDTDESSLPQGPPVAYTPGDLVASACVGAEQFQTEELEYTPFSSAAAALEGIAGTWARCLDHVEADHAGIRILPDGSWHHLAIESGELVARFGFGHEGFLQFIDTSSMNGEPGLFQVNLQPSGRRYGTLRSSIDDYVTWASENALVFDSSAEGWPAAVYLPTLLPVRSDAPQYAEGERVGEAACDQEEYGIVTEAEMPAALTGEFVLCSGSLQDGVARLRFDGADIELTRQDGAPIAALEYRWEGSALAIGADNQFRWWQVVASRQPTKLWIRESRDYGENTAVFSALP